MLFHRLGILLLLSLSLPLASPLAAQPLQGRIKKILKLHPRVHWGLYAVQAKNGRVLAKWNEQQFFVPASNTKLFSTSFALATFGPEHRFHTRVLASAPPDENGVLHGNLVLYGEGDPSLSSRIYPYDVRNAYSPDRLAPLRELAAQLKQKNIRLVTGSLIGDDTYFEHRPVPSGWGAGDSQYSYGAPVSALSFNDNAIAWKSENGQIVLDPPLPEYTPSLPASRPSGEFAVDDPALFAARAFRLVLEQEGIAVLGPTEARHTPQASPEQIELARRTSPPLDQLLTVANKVSQNLHCELLRRAAEKQQKLEDFLRRAGVNPERDTYLTDGSGLSRQNLVSPVATVSLLRHLWSTPWREQFASFLPTGATDGTLRRRFNGNERARAIQAKTGTLSHVSALGGYATSKKYGTVIFQIVANNFNEPSAGVLAAIDALALEFVR
ncbi:MAG: D-alanyl-D-alanine carboxypeptidase [Bryobacter sp.]|nr:D-alanyl-D-alanine carboxypeptidase [Bryobacter sp.]